MAFNRLLVILSLLIKRGTPSITGVTYMDHFDFEQRYENIHECDPMHWYPLHMPQECMEMYEKLIRENIGSASMPVRVVKERETYRIDPSTLYSQSSMEPYNKMFHFLRQDVRKYPRAPQITNVPGLGVVALYKQPISKQSGQYIKKIVGAYRDVHINYNQFFQEYSTTENPEEKTNLTENIKKDYEFIEKEKIMKKLKDIFGTRK